MEETMRKPGRPPKAAFPVSNNSPEPLELTEKPVETQKAKVGSFIVINTPTIKGVRLNLEKVRTYGVAGPEMNELQIAWDNGTASTYRFGNTKDANEMLQMIDEYCI